MISGLLLLDCLTNVSTRNWSRKLAGPLQVNRFIAPYNFLLPFELYLKANRRTAKVFSIKQETKVALEF